MPSNSNGSGKPPRTPSIAASNTERSSGNSSLVAPTPSNAEIIASAPSKIATSHILSVRPERVGNKQASEDQPLEKQNPKNFTEGQKKSRIKTYIDLVVWFLQDQWFLITLGILIAISSQVQVPPSHQHLKETIVTYLAVSIIFFITGCTLPTKVLLENYSRWKIHLFVQIQCFLMTSAMTFGIVSACATSKTFMDPWLLIGIIFVGCVPTTISSNAVMTRQAHGNTALTVVQSMLGNFLGPFLTPALFSMYSSTGAWYTHVLPSAGGAYSEIYRRVFKQLGLSLFLPLFIGQVVQNLFPGQTKKVFTDWKFSKLGSLALLTIIWQTFDQAFGSGAFNSVKGDNIVFIIFISIALFILWLSVCFATSLMWLPKQDVIACCYCCPAKTPAIGVPLSSVMYVGLAAVNESKIQIPIVIYQAFQIAAGSVLTIAFRKWIRPEEEKRKEVREREAFNIAIFGFNERKRPG